MQVQWAPIPTLTLMEQPRRILVAGLGKSGTTALYFKIRNSMPEATRCFFEPRQFAVFDETRGTGLPLLAKVLTPLPADFLPHLGNCFSHRVLIVRDPRDVLVSSLLYNSAYAYLWRYPPERIAEALELLRTKETSRAPTSVLTLLAALRDDFSRSAFADFVRRMLGDVTQLAEPGYGFLVVYYEDMVAGRTENLANYLGFPLTGSGEVDTSLRRVERTKGSGGWRDWLLPEDVAYFRPLLDSFLRRFHYDADDWMLKPEPSISPDHCSEYVLRVLNERRRAENLAPVRPPLNT